jgi:alpha-1,2-mannosyltransferase
MRATNDQLAVVTILGAALALGWINMFRYGTDFLDMLLGGQRLLAGTNLYEGSGPAFGMIGPPAQALLLAPFAVLAQLDLSLARASWFLLNFAGLVFGARAWSAALGVPRVTWWLVLAAGCAVAFPLYREFQAQNMTLLLFWLVGLAAANLVNGHETRAGLAVGFATAVKLFPGLLIVYFLARARWRAAWAAMASAAVISVLPIFRFGPTGFIEVLREWVQTRTAGDWPIWNQNQSLSAAIWREVPGDTGLTLGAVSLAVLVGCVVWLGWTRRANTSSSMSDEMALVLIVSVLASPIAWVCYWLLCMPLFMIATRQMRVVPMQAAGVFILGAFLISVVDAWRRSAPGGELIAAAFLLIGAVTMWLPKERVHVAQ